MQVTKAVQGFVSSRAEALGGDLSKKKISIARRNSMPSRNANMNLVLTRRGPVILDRAARSFQARIGGTTLHGVCFMLTAGAIQTALEAAGVELIPADDERAPAYDRSTM